MKKHLHHDAIVAWAGGAQIQWHHNGSGWMNCLHVPEWRIDHEYRVKPEPKYPTTRMTGNEVFEIWQKSPQGVAVARPLIDVANAALRHACDAGQVVPREEFDRELADREARDIAIINATLLEAASIINSMGAGLANALCEKLCDVADAVKLAPITAIIQKVDL